MCKYFKSSGLLRQIDEELSNGREGFAERKKNIDGKKRENRWREQVTLPRESLRMAMPSPPLPKHQHTKKCADAAKHAPRCNAGTHVSRIQYCKTHVASKLCPSTNNAENLAKAGCRQGRSPGLFKPPLNHSYIRDATSGWVQTHFRRASAAHF